MTAGWSDTGSNCQNDVFRFANAVSEMSFRRFFYGLVYFFVFFHIKETSFVYLDKRGFFVAIHGVVRYNCLDRCFSVRYENETDMAFNGI